MRWQHELTDSTAKTPGVAINVLDAFQGGGATCCPNSSKQDQLDFQDYLTYTNRKHTLRGGLQLLWENHHDLNASNFNGNYTFSSLDQYRQVLAGAHVNPNDPSSPLVRATQFTINRGNPLLSYSQYEASLFAQDDIRLRPNFTLSAGLRYEFQSHLQDKFNLAPRLGIAWSPSKDRKTTVRTGGGIFLNRLAGGVYEKTLRFDGFMLRGDRRFGRNFALFVNYTLSWTKSDSDGTQSLPANSYDLHSEWGPAYTDRRHFLNITSMVSLPHGFRLTPFVVISSGTPFNIMTGQDDNFDTVINDRPAGIHRNSDLPASLYSLIPNRCIADCTPGQVPVLLRDFLETNYPNGVHAVNPGSFNFNMSLAKTFALGHSNNRLAQNNPGGSPDGAQPDGQDQASPDSQNSQGGGRGG